MDPRDRYVQLYTYLGGYLHEDWMDDYADVEEALQDYLSEADESGIAQLVVEIEALSAAPDVTTEVQTLSRNFRPLEDGGVDEREWLQSLRARAAQELAAREAGPPE